MSIDISNKVCNQNISVELDNKRNNFCPSKGSFNCSHNCPIYINYYHLGLSCNDALDKHSDECIKLMDEFEN